MTSGLARFTRDSTSPVLLGNATNTQHQDFTYGALTLSGRPSQTLRLPQHQRAAPRRRNNSHAPQPRTRNARRLSHTHSLGHHPLSLTTTHGISLPTGTKMFHFPAYPSAPYTFRHERPGTTPARLPHSDTLGSTPARRLPEAYRRPQRPSSAPGTQASTERP